MVGVGEFGSARGVVVVVFVLTAAFWTDACVSRSGRKPTSGACIPLMP